MPVESVPASLAARVKAIVDRSYRGKVRQAARAAGIPQQTLDRIVRGDSENPRGAVLQKFAQRNRVSVEWLLTGSGKGPDDAEAEALALNEEAKLELPELPGTPPELRSGEAYHWSQIVALLGLPLPVRRTMWKLPIATLEAAFTLVIKLPSEQECAADPRAMQRALERETPLIEAFRLERRAWITFFEEWIRLDGKEKVRDLLVANPQLTARRFVIRSVAAPQPMKRKRSHTTKRPKR